MRIPIVMMLVALTSVASADDRVVLSGKVTDATTGAVVAGATVIVSRSSGVVHSLATDAQGQYAAAVEPGTYSVIFVYGGSRSTGNVVVGQDAARLDGRVDVTSGEIIVIKEKLKPPVPPAPKNFVASKAPPYSDQAVLTNAWTKAWLLLDVDEHGVVERMKFLKHPGYDLEQIARSEASNLRFEPARDRNGKPVRSYVVWPIEWPSAWWLGMYGGTRSGMPPYRWTVGGKVRIDNIEGPTYVPCAGSGPLNFNAPGDMYVYKDCSKPDLAQAAREPWLPSTVARK